jgi:glycosyltransferase involved in cell wall biosynthesis
MKVMLLAPANVVHTRRWVEGLHARGVEPVLVTQHDPDGWTPPPGVTLIRLRHSGTAGYFLNVLQVRRLLREGGFDLLNAHYASGYGTTAALCGFRPWLLSVWGSDVYDFPYENAVKGWLLRHNLRQANLIASTSRAMAGQVRRLLPGVKDVALTPFGIDTKRFAAAPEVRRGFVVGTVKTLAPKYGVDVLVKAFAEFLKTLPLTNGVAPSLLIVGGGEQRAELQALGESLGITERLHFAGAVAHADVPEWLNRFDVYVAVSRLDSESFGVAVLEASACELPVVVSDAGGLPEVVVHGETGLVVPRDDVQLLAQALRRLHDDPALRQQLGRAGRERVLREYEWEHCVDLMLGCYERAVRGVIADAGSAMTWAAPPRAQTVSVIVPCRNERAHIDVFCAGVMRQVLPAGWQLELLIADGRSDDGTRERLEQLAQTDARIVWIDNPQRIVSTGLNLALARSQGEVIVRLDVHSEYADDYVAQCIAVLQETGADNAGGAWHAQPASDAGPMQQAAAAAFQSRWVAGGASSRRLDLDGEVDTVYLGSWPRRSFERHGGFDETLVRNQDDEHNLRIVRGGGVVRQSSTIRSVYRPRARLSQVFRQYLQYGYWKPFVMKKHGQPASLRHLVPAVFVGLLAFSGVYAAIGGATGPWKLLLWLYLAGLIGLTATVAAGSPSPLPFTVLLRVPLVIAAYHFGYGIGSLFGWWDVLVHGKGRERFAALTR